MLKHFLKRPRFLLSTLMVLGGCASSGSSGSDTVGGDVTATVTSYYDPDVRAFPKEAGQVLLGSDGLPTTMKSGRWTTWYSPIAGNTKESEKTYVENVWDDQQYWREWNSDTSVRFDWQDR